MNSREFSAIGNDLPEPFRIQIMDQCASTNDEARTLGEQHAPDGRVVLALKQTKGRGRRGSTWFSGADDTLAFSILVRPTEPKGLWPRLALAAGVAVAEALENHLPHAAIKWPNDVWIDEKKVAGILVEAGHDFAVIGIGININTDKFPAEIAHLATSLRIACGNEVARSEVFADVIRRLSIRRHQIGRDFTDLLEAVRTRCVLTGQQVSYQVAGVPHRGEVVGIGDGGELLMKRGDQIERLLQADEIRILPPA